MAALARQTKLRNCTFHNLRFYPQVQQMRRMIEDGDLGEILVVQGTYSQDWLLFDTDYNWRIESKDNGPSRCLADIGSHWCDMAEHVTGQRITSVCADLSTFHKTRRKPKGPIETFAGKMLTAEDYVPYEVDTEDYGGVIFRMGNGARGVFTASQLSAGRKNRLSIEIYGTKAGVAWDQERPDELWIGQRNSPNQIIVKDPSLLKERARSYADLPGGHSEGYDDTFKQVFRRFYNSIGDPAMDARVPAVRGWPAPVEHPRSRAGKLPHPRLGRRSPVPGHGLVRRFAEGKARPAPPPASARPAPQGPGTPDMPGPARRGAEAQPKGTQPGF